MQTKNVKTMNTADLFTHFNEVLRMIHTAVPGTSAMEEAVGLRDTCVQEMTYRMEKNNRQHLSAQSVQLYINALLQLQKQATELVFLDTPQTAFEDIQNLIHKLHSMIYHATMIMKSCKGESPVMMIQPDCCDRSFHDGGNLAAAYDYINDSNLIGNKEAIITLPEYENKDEDEDKDKDKDEDEDEDKDEDEDEDNDGPPF